MRRLFLLIGLLACVLLASGCGLFSRKLLSRKYSPTRDGKPADMYIGVVESVNPEQKFVVVRTDMRMGVAAGTILESRSLNGTKAMLLVTPERKLNFLSADISAGLPVAGDIVVIPAQVAAPMASLSAPAPAPTVEVPELFPAPGLPRSGEPSLPLPLPQ